MRVSKIAIENLLFFQYTVGKRPGYKTREFCTSYG